MRAFADIQWLRAFAARLAGDADDAEGLVQDTLVEAWRDPPADGSRSVRPWLASVFRNRLRMARRGRARRQRREQLVADAREVVRPDDAHDRLEVLSILLAELRQLPRDDQQILVRRFFEGQSAAEIARARDVPAATIRSRIHRSLARLRASLDERYGDRKTWSAAVLAIPVGTGATPDASAASRPMMTVTAKTLLAAAALALGTGAYVYASTPAPRAPATAPPSTDPVAEVSAPEPTPRSQWQARRARIRTALTAAPAPAADAAAPDRAERAAASYRELVRACIDDLDSKAVGALTLSIHELGTPDVGTIYESVEVVHTNFDDAETLECLVQSMYAYVGEPPDGPVDRIVVRTMPLGEPETLDEKTHQVIGYIVGAHAGEVRFCESKAEGEVAGTVVYTMTIDDDGNVARSTPGPTDLPPAVVACITTATERWRWSKTVAGKTFRHEFSLPIPGQLPGPR